jgi:hypothetical protein
MVGASANRIPFLCALGSHSPAPYARWNGGYYFSKCTRCGRDLVRTGYGRWHEPKGYRVVWQAEPPAGFVSADLVRKGEVPPPIRGGELPIQEVIRHVQNGDRAGEAPRADLGASVVEQMPEPGPGPGGEPVQERHQARAAASPEEPAPLLSRAVPARPIPDFMDEGTQAGAWEVPSRRYLLRSAPADRRPEGEAGSGFDRYFGWLSRLGPRFAAAIAPARGEPRVESAAETVPREPGRWRSPWGLIAAIALVVLLVLVFWAGRATGPSAGASSGAAQGPSLGHGQAAFVTAGVLNCRSAPALEAEPVKILVRGDAVRLIARDGEWVSLVQTGGQCWALARYFSAERPL